MSEKYLGFGSAREKPTGIKYYHIGHINYMLVERFVDWMNEVFERQAVSSIETVINDGESTRFIIRSTNHREFSLWEERDMVVVYDENTQCFYGMDREDFEQKYQIEE